MNGSQLQAKPLKVFILAGLSNMEGHAKVENFYYHDDPATAPPLKMMRGPDRLDEVRMPFSGNAQAQSDAAGKTPKNREGAIRAILTPSFAVQDNGQFTPKQPRD